jgi:CDP-4-dehydro-6-deoxyglucose reductase, E1
MAIEPGSLKGKRVLVTGATGFIGSHLVKRLITEGARVTAFTRHTSDRRRLRSVLTEIDVREVDIRTFGAVSGEIDKVRPEIVFHLSAEGVTEPFLPHNLALRANLDGTVNVVRAAVHAGAQRIIHTGTSHEYGDRASDGMLDPISPYAASKAAAWAFCRMYYRTEGWPIVTLRLFQVFGPGQESTLVPSAIEAGLNGHIFPTTPGEQIRDWVYVEDVVDAYLHAAVVEGIEGETFDIGTGNGTRVRDVVEEIFRHFADGHPNIGALPYRPGEVWSQVAKIDHARSKLGWQAQISLPEGLSRTISARRDSMPDAPPMFPPSISDNGSNSTEDSTKDQAQRLHDDILNKVTDYYRLIHEPASWERSKGRVHYAGRVFDEHEMRNMADSVLEFWLTAGRYAERFEEKLGAFLGVREVIPVNSGSSANLVAVSTLCSRQLLSRHLEPGDEVITPAVTFPTTLAPIVQNQLIPVLIDSQMGNYNLDVNQLEAALSPRTRAIFAPHTLGNPIEMDVLMDFARAHELYVIEDNCDALGSTYGGRKTGTIGHIGTSSFYPAHHITLGEGGAVYTNSRRLAKIARTIRDWGRDCWCGYINPPNGRCGKRFDWQIPGEEEICYDHRYFFTEIGYNLKLTDPQAAVGVAQIEKLPDFVSARKRNFRVLFEGLKPLEEFLILPTWSPKADPSWFAFPLTVRPGAPFDRSQLQRFLEDRRIETRLLFAGNIVKQPGFRHIAHRVVNDLPVADLVMGSTFFVGVYPGLSQSQLGYMLEVFYDFAKSLDLAVAG